MSNHKTKRRYGGTRKGRTARERSRKRPQTYESLHPRSRSRSRSRSNESPKYADVDISKLIVADKHNLFPGQTYFVVNIYTGKRTPAKFVRYPKTRYTQYMDGPDTSNAVFIHKGTEMRLATEEFDAYEVNVSLRLKSKLPSELIRTIGENLHK